MPQSKKGSSIASINLNGSKISQDRLHQESIERPSELKYSSRTKGDGSESDFDESALTWQRDIQPYVQKKIDQAFEKYRTWQQSQIKEFTQHFEAKMSKQAEEQSFSFSNIRENLEVMQGEIHSLQQMKIELQESGIVTIGDDPGAAIAEKQRACDQRLQRLERTIGVLANYTQECTRY